MAAQTGSVRDHSGFTLWAAAGLIVVLFLLFIAVLSLSIVREWRDTQKRAEDQALAGSQVVATNARWVVELSRQALGRIDEALGPDIEANAEATSVLIREAIETLPGNVKSYVVAADGRTLFSTDPNIRPIDVRDRPYFSALANGDSWYFSPLLVSRLDGSQIFVVSKRLMRGGQFVGAAIISFDVLLLEQTWQSLGLDALSTISLIRGDGQLVARYPLADGPLDLSKYVLFTEYLPANDVGAYPATSPADGVTRIVAYRRVGGTPYVALAAISTESAFALFRRNTLITLFFALPTALALAGATAWIIRLLRRDQRRREQLSEALELNSLLVKDTHHRVKNNLQAIMSMVRMHTLPDQLKTDLQSRISAMSAVHEHLYRLDQFAEVDAATLVPGIVEPLREAFALPVEVSYDIDPLVLDRDRATPLALLVSEVVTNALKYAFPDGREGRIAISLKQQGSGDIRLTVADDGVGFDTTKASNGLGSRLIRAMLVQLDGTSRYEVEGGTRFEATLSPRAVNRPQQATQSGAALASAQPA
ncbi:histidine kinase dimerization/phosphoacceptor domain -containing protein [Mesorhizobium sp. KR9-304]|uniref:sensor histidine kinase n=1 Tax=Mesorhizobium sp. KR9-304 TaxID=3156614 RepID=UPI0032B3F516